MFEKNDKKQETPQRNLRRFLYWGEPKKEHFVLRDRTLRFIFSERFVLRIIITLAYTLPKTLTRMFHCNNLTVAAYLRNPFYIYRTLKLFDAESTDGTSWIYQAQIGGTTATARSFGLTLRANF